MSDRREKGQQRSGSTDAGSPPPDGACLVTICTRYRECLFGHVINGAMRLNQTGEIARRFWEEVPRRFPSVVLDAFVIMPNHLHGILVASSRGRSRSGAAGGPAGQPPGAAPAAIVRWYKSSSTRRINEAHSMPGTPIWDRGHQEHLVRHQRELLAVREYIQDNPALWEDDENHPAFQRRSARG